MKFLSKLIVLTAIVFMAVSCGRNAQNRVDTQAKDHGPNGIGVANDPTTDSATFASTDSAAQGSLHQGTGDAYFVKTAANGGPLEIKLGELAVQNGSSTQVKEFGRTMTVDHKRSSEELKRLAREPQYFYS